MQAGGLVGSRRLMACSYLRAALVCVLLCLLDPNLQAAETVVWAGSSEMFSIRGSTADIVIKTKGQRDQRGISFRALTNAEWLALVRSDKGQPLEFEKRYRLLSAVGPYLSFEEETSCDCGGAHPTVSRRIRAVHLAKSHAGRLEAARLTDLFPEEDLVAALENNSEVRQALGAADQPSPQTLNALFTSPGVEGVTIGGRSYLFSPDILDSFAFDHSQGDKTTIHLSLPYNGEVNRGDLATIELLLPIPDVLKAALKAAESKRSGILLTEADALFEGGVTVFRFRTKGTPLKDGN